MKNLSANEKYSKRRKYSTGPNKSNDLVLNLFLRSGLFASIILNFILLPFAFVTFQTMPLVVAIIASLTVFLALGVLYKNNYNTACYVASIDVYVSLVLIMILYSLGYQVPVGSLMLNVYNLTYIFTCAGTFLIVLRLVMYFHNKFKLQEKLFFNFLKDFLSIFICTLIIIVTIILVTQDLQTLTNLLENILLYVFLSSIIYSVILLIANKFMPKPNYSKTKYLQYRKFKYEKHNANNAKSTESSKKDGGTTERD